MIERSRRFALWGDDAWLVEALRGLPDRRPVDHVDVRSALHRAEEHGLAGVLQDALFADASAVPRDLAARALARELDATATWQMVARIDEAFVTANLRGVVLKGHVFARRFYPRPSARQTTDIDLMVDFDALDAARVALETLGYVMSETEKNDVALDEHHHWLLVHPHAAPVELHFHAYRGFGECLPSQPLLARATSIEAHRALCVLDPSDELLFLCVHAAGHRFERLSWLYDIHLLVATLDVSAIDRAMDRAAEFGYRRVVAYALSLVHDAFGDDVGPSSPGIVRRAIANATTRIPHTPVLRAATRFIYTTALADSVSAAGRYAQRSSLDHLRALL